MGSIDITLPLTISDEITELYKVHIYLGTE